MESKSSLSSDLPMWAAELYARLREYNLSIVSHCASLTPEWLTIYTNEKPPEYWSVLARLLKQMKSVKSCMEIGAGIGDVSVLMAEATGAPIYAVERDPILANLCKAKFDAFGLQRSHVLKAEFPVRVHFVPELLVMVNCVYGTSGETHDSYLRKIGTWRAWNGIPTYFVYEAVEPTPEAEATTFPPCIRLTHEDIRSLFPQTRISAYQTYRPPDNRTAKTLYLIERRP